MSGQFKTPQQVFLEESQRAEAEVMRRGGPPDTTIPMPELVGNTVKRGCGRCLRTEDEVPLVPGSFKLYCHECAMKVAREVAEYQAACRQAAGNSFDDLNWDPEPPKETA